MALLDSSACFVCPAGGKHAVTKTLWPPVAAPKQLQASGESPPTPANRLWHDNGCAGLLPICRATPHVHGLAGSLLQSSARSTGVVWHMLYRDCACQVLLPFCMAGRPGRLKRQQTAATGRPAASARVVTAPKRPQTLRSQCDLQIQIQAGDLETACWGAPRCSCTKPLLPFWTATSLSTATY